MQKIKKNALGSEGKFLHGDVVYTIRISRTVFIKLPPADRLTEGLNDDSRTLCVCSATVMRL